MRPNEVCDRANKKNKSKKYDGIKVEGGPKIFRVLRTIGLALAAASGAILVAPVALPAALVTAAGYLAVAGGVATAVSQTAVEVETPPADVEGE